MKEKSGMHGNKGEEEWKQGKFGWGVRSKVVDCLRLKETLNRYASRMSSFFFILCYEPNFNLFFWVYIMRNV